MHCTPSSILHEPYITKFSPEYYLLRRSIALQWILATNPTRIFGRVHRYIWLYIGYLAGFMGHVGSIQLTLEKILFEGWHTCPPHPHALNNSNKVHKTICHQQPSLRTIYTNCALRTPIAGGQGCHHMRWKERLGCENCSSAAEGGSCVCVGGGGGGGGPEWGSMNAVVKTVARLLLSKTLEQALHRYGSTCPNHSLSSLFKLPVHWQSVLHARSHL